MNGQSQLSCGKPKPTKLERGNSPQQLLPFRSSSCLCRPDVRMEYSVGGVVSQSKIPFGRVQHPLGEDNEVLVRIPGKIQTLASFLRVVPEGKKKNCTRQCWGGDPVAKFCVLKKKIQNKKQNGCPMRRGAWREGNWGGGGRGVVGKHREGGCKGVSLEGGGNGLVL